MKAIAINEIRRALRYGEEKGYILFPEIRDDKWRKQVKVHPVTQIMAKDILVLADQVKDKEEVHLPFKRFMDFLENGNRFNYEKIFFANKNELHALVMAELIQGEGTYIEAIEERLWHWCNNYSWELPAHVPLTKEAIINGGYQADQIVALFSAESGFYFAEILDLIREKIHPLLAYRLEKEIERRILEPYQASTYWWESAGMNWASVCSGATGCAAIYQVKNTDKLAGIVHRVIGSMQAYLTGFDSEGVTTEGLGYWQYGFSFYLYFSELLKERTGGMIDLLDMDECIEKIANLPTYLQFPSMHMVNFSDAPGDKWFGEYGILARLAKKFDIADYQYSKDIDIFRDHTSKWALLSRNVFWTVTETIDNTQQAWQGCRYFKESQWFIDRSYTEDGKFVAFAAKGGNNNEPHNHNDLGHFILNYDGQPFMCDLGAPEYVKAFFSHERYSFLQAASDGHSVPIIDGELQRDGSAYMAEILQVNEEQGEFCIDLTHAYKVENVSAYTRIFQWDQQQLCLRLQENWEVTRPGVVIEEIFMTPYPAELEGNKVVIRGPLNQMILEANQPMAITIEPLTYVDHFVQEQVVYRIRMTHRLDTLSSQTYFEMKIV